MNSSSHRLAFGAVALMTFINTLGFSVFIPILPFIVQDAGFSPRTYGFLLSIYSVFQLFGSPWLGGLSDQFGRRPLLILSHLGTLVSWGVYALAFGAQAWGGAAVVGLIALARSFDGITAGNSSVANAYLSDIIPPEQRATKYGQLGALTGLGLIIGPAVGAWAAGFSIGWLGTVFFSMILSAVTLICLATWVPETLPKHLRQKPTRTVLQQINLFRTMRDLWPNVTARRMLITQLWFSLAFSGYTSIIVLVLIDRFAFDEQQIGWFLMFVGSFVILNQAILVKPFVRKLGEFRTLLCGLISMCVGVVGVAFSGSIITFVLWYYFVNLGVSLAIPTIKAMLSGAMTAQEQGRGMGADLSMSALAFAIAPAVMGAAYATWGGVAYVGLAVMVLGLLGWLGFATKTVSKPMA